MKRGSALLIVLGMLAFIVASAVAFSAYMRYARMPSSYLRRTSSSRLLAKAALAEAIDVIDTSIGNDLFPGQKGRNFVKTYKRITDGETPDDVIDYWQDRCFIGSDRLVSVDDTVATLCTEALAYIPPPIINEVRYYSRRSIAGKWHTLGYDSGRFAFTAVDVSDFFDVNSVCATPLDIDGQHMYGRNSSDTGRITLAHVFENAQHTGYTYEPDDWDAFMDHYLDSGKLPLVSVADLNLAMNKQGLPAYMSPFCNYIRNEANFVESDSAAVPEVNLVRNMAFVTDGLFAVTNRRAQALDISRRKDQPFYGHERGKTVQELIAQENSDFRRRLDAADSPFFNQCEIVQLYDYLDEDSIPLSLALPTVERTPMITGVALGGDLNVIVTSKDCEKVSADGTAKYSYKTYTLKLVSNGLDANFGAVYPFKYDHGASASYQMEAVATIAFVPSCKPEEGLLRCSGAAAPGVVTLQNGSWSVNGSWETAAYSGNKPSVVRRKTAAKQVTLPTRVQTDSDAVIDDEKLQLQFGSLNIEFVSDLPASEFCNPNDLKCTFRSPAKKMTKDPATGQFTIPDSTFVDPAPLADRIGWLPVKEDLSGVVPEAELVGQTFTPTVQVWVRIFTGNDTVDLVPACWKDDKSPSEILPDDARGTTHYPMLRFRGTDPAAAGVTLANDTLTGGAPIDFYPKAYIADDPRFNFAPENFEALATQEAPFDQLWLTRARTSSARDDRDGDIFMATSDAGYLQSAYELSYILQVSPDGDGFGVVSGNGYNGRAGSMPAKAAMWRTYSQYDNGSSSDEIDYLDIINGSRGFRVNPYTPSTDIMLAALANSPLDWWSASTNETVNTKVHDSAANAAKYAFSEMGASPVKMKHANLEAIAKRMIGAFRGSNGDWRQEFDRLGWDGDPDTLCGVTLDNNVKLHSVDRKFLHGFWKESIANRQQLFLIFVRAEPMMMGGGGMGQTPPQLGARAVALVWRDPTKTADDVAGLSTSGGPRPHRTRILFYRQFD